MALLDVKISEDSFKTVQQKLGPSELRTLESKEEHPPLHVCYRSASGHSWFWFQSGPTGEWSKIDSITMATHPRRGDEVCSPLAEANDEPGYGRLKVGLSRRAVEKVLGKRRCSASECRLTERRPELTLTVVVGLKDEAVDSIVIWQGDGT
jgi:hypothetical protein